MERLIVRLLLVLAVGTTAVVLATDRIPLGVPGEWTWDRISLDTLSEVGLILALAGGAVYVGFAVIGGCRFDRAGTIERSGWLLALVTAGFAWQYAAIESLPSPYGYARVPWILYYPRSSGYFWQARYDVEDARSLLAGYEELLAERDYLHIGTHPPGLTLGYLGLIQLCEKYPQLPAAVLSTQPAGVRDAIATIRDSPANGAEPLTAVDEACLWLAALITQLSAAMTVLGVYGLAVRHCDRKSAWMAACLWPLVPAIVVFFPKSDLLYPFLAVSATWLWMSACDRGSILRAILAGLMLWAGMFLSLAFITIAALMGVMSLWEAWARPPEARSRPFLTIRLVVCALIGFAIPTITLAVSADINLIKIWSWNFSNHATFYEHNVRTPREWLLVNPIELAMAVGLPIVVTAAYGTLARAFSGLRTPRLSTAVAFALVWGALWISGKNMGEAARLWILIMPWVVLIAGQGLARAQELQAVRPTKLGSIGLWVLVAQCMVAVATIVQVDGFHFGELLSN